ncbi:MAG: DUF1254 domain-containing protein [Clostridia bacterium]|nr:DUF1254 domain-containing protein [Clostridia bacterium]
MKRVFALMVCMAMLLSGCAVKQPSIDAPAADSAADSEADVWETLEKAYIYAFPLVLMDATMTSATNTETVIAGKAPVNQFMHGAGTVTAAFKTVVTPNVDTVYTQVWLDLGEEPIIYTMPEADRFFNVQLLDGWTNTVDVLTNPATYAFTYAGWNGELPEGVIRVDFPTQMAWFIARCLLKGEDDLANVKAIQNAMSIMPLSAYVSDGEYTAPQGSYSESNDFVPVNKVLSMSPAEFFAKANELMAKNPPAAEDAAILEQIAAVNVGPDKVFDVSVLTGDIAAQWKEMLTGLRSKLVADGSRFSVKMDQWSYFGRPIGDFGTEYSYRAMIALGGLGANTLDVAMYTKTDTDASGSQMSGAHTYKIHFNTLPPVLDNGFWSVTAYGSDDFLIDNPLNRYCINDRSEFVLNADGTLDIIVSASAPESTSNWLPVNEDNFHLYMRIYSPDMTAIETWEAPVITIID